MSMETEVNISKSVSLLEKLREHPYIAILLASAALGPAAIASGCGDKNSTSSGVAKIEQASALPVASPSAGGDLPGPSPNATEQAAAPTEALSDEDVAIILAGAEASFAPPNEMKSLKGALEASYSKDAVAKAHITKFEAVEQLKLLQADLAAYEEYLPKIDEYVQNLGQPSLMDMMETGYKGFVVKEKVYEALLANAAEDSEYPEGSISVKIVLPDGKVTTSDMMVGELGGSADHLKSIYSVSQLEEMIAELQGMMTGIDKDNPVGILTDTCLINMHQAQINILKQYE